MVVRSMFHSASDLRSTYFVAFSVDFCGISSSVVACLVVIVKRSRGLSSKRASSKRAQLKAQHHESSISLASAAFLSRQGKAVAV